jgi:hypothetical protein
MSSDNFRKKGGKTDVQLSQNRRKEKKKEWTTHGAAWDQRLLDVALGAATDRRLLVSYQNARNKLRGRERETDIIKKVKGERPC